MRDIAARHCARVMQAGRLAARLVMALVLLIVLALPALAQTPPPGAAPAASAATPQAAPATPGGSPSSQATPPQFINQEMYNESFRILFALFVLAVLIESGLAVVFNWRPFVDTFDSRGVKTLVSVGFCYFIVETFDFDAMTKLINVYAGVNQAVNLPGKIVTALILAGGSSGVNNIMISLGFRSAKPQETQAKPPPTEAWISVSLVRRQSRGPVTIRVGTDANALAVAGTITGSARPGGRVVSYFLRDRGRFPSTGGHPVAAGQTYIIDVVGIDANGAAIATTAKSRWGPYPLAPGAIVDLDLTL
jgi:hypothetical protein